MHIHTHIHIHTYIHMHACIHTLPHILLIDIEIILILDIAWRYKFCARTQARIRAYVYTHTHDTHTLPHILLLQTASFTLLSTLQILAQTCIRAYAYTNIHTHTHTHTQNTHIHTYITSYSPIANSIFDIAWHVAHWLSLPENVCVHVMHACTYAGMNACMLPVYITSSKLQDLHQTIHTHSQTHSQPYT